MGRQLIESIELGTQYTCNDLMEITGLSRLGIYRSIKMLEKSGDCDVRRRVTKEGQFTKYYYTFEKE